MELSFSYLHGQPQSTSLLRQHMSDFKVIEQLPFEPCGEGEHLFIYVRKTGTNTVFVARQLAKYFSVKEALVSYAGLKDRFAETEQWFSVHLPGKTHYDLSDLEIEGVEVLQYARHNKKLKTGVLSGNRFEITLREVSDIDDIKQRWQLVTRHGVPNYFGEQRFGIDGGNLDRALELFSGTKVKDKKKRGIYLSAARSYLFNYLVDKRIQQNHFMHPMAGDVFMLSGTQSVFVPETNDQTIMERLLMKDIDITAPMWGAGELMSHVETQELEATIKSEFADICAGLAKFGLKQERRRIRLNISEPGLEIDGDVVTLSFFLPAGCYATTVLREVTVYQDMTVRAEKQ